MITLANLKDATKQQVFDQVATHLLKQNQQCRSFDSQCVYRGGKDNNLMCAAGCLIGEDEYKPEMDRAGYVDNVSFGSNWTSLIKRGLVPETPHTNFIADLQDLHDHVTPDKWAMRLETLAAKNGLVFNPVV